MRLLRTARTAAAAIITLSAVTIGPTTVVDAAPAAARCSDSVDAVGFSDALDKRDSHGRRIGGLSALAFDARSGHYLALSDRGSVIWAFTDPAQPRIVGAPIILKDATGRALRDDDNEGLAVGRDGTLIVSSETRPSIRVFGRNGRQRFDVPIPASFRVLPLGRGQTNATLEGLTMTPSGQRLIAAMEDPLLGESDSRTHRFLDYRRTASGRWALTRELIYRAGTGMRIADVAAYGEDRLVVLEAAYAPTSGNSVVLTTSRMGPSAGTSGSRAVDRRVLADLTRCPTLGAKAKEPQRNSLLDNYEGLSVTRAGSGYTLRLISDDNFSAKQVTRLLTLSARLP